MAFIDSLKRVLYDIFSNPVALVLFALWIFCSIAEYYGKSHPLESLVKEFEYLKRARGIDLSIPISVIKHMILNKHQTTLIALHLITLVLKPTFVCVVIVVVYSAYIIVHPSIDFYYHLCISVATFMYLIIKGPRNKFLVVLVCAAFVYIKYIAAVYPEAASSATSTTGKKH